MHEFLFVLNLCPDQSIICIVNFLAMFAEVETNELGDVVQRVDLLGLDNLFRGQKLLKLPTHLDSWCEVLD